MKIFDILRTANHNLWRNKVRTGLTILAIFVGSFTIILNVAINAGANGFIDDQMNAVGGDDLLFITKGVSMHDAAMNQMGASSNEVQEYRENAEMEYMKAEDLEALKKVDGIDPNSVSERSFGSKVDYIRGAKNDKKFVGVGAGTMPPGNIRVPLTAGVVAPADAAEDQIVLSADYPQALGYESDAAIVGATIWLGVRDIMTNEFVEFPAKVVGVQAPGVIVYNGHMTNKALEEKIAAVNDKYSSTVQQGMFGMAQATYDTAKFSEDEIKQKLEDAGYAAITMRDMASEIRMFFDVILVVFSIFGGIALLAAAIGIVNTLYMSVEERTREIGLDKALGMSSGRVFAEFATEAILLGFWGSIVGVGIAMLLGNGVNQIVHAPGGFLEVFPTFELFKFTLDGILPIVIVVMTIAFIAGTLPAIKAARKNPIDALRYE